VATTDLSVDQKSYLISSEPRIFFGLHDSKIPGTTHDWQFTIVAKHKTECLGIGKWFSLDNSL